MLYNGYYIEEMDLEAISSSEVRYMLVNTNYERLVSRKNRRSLARHVNLWTRYPLFVKDHFTTLANARWSIIFAVVASCFVISWVLFAVSWLIIANVNDRCVSSANGEVLTSFSTALLFAVETQVTIGYGELFIKSECTAGVLLLLLQCLFAYFIEAFLIGLVFTKLSRPRKRAETILFSNKFIVCSKPDKQEAVDIQQAQGITKCVKFRIADIRHSQLVEAHVRLYLYWNKCCHGYDDKQLQQYELEVGYESGHDRVFLLLPIEVNHVILPSSPFYDWSYEMFSEEDYEMVVVLEGIVEATGMTSQIVWSYLPSEVCFNQHFSPMVHRFKGHWEVDFSQLNNMTNMS